MESELEFLKDLYESASKTIKENPLTSAPEVAELYHDEVFKRIKILTEEEEE